MKEKTILLMIGLAGLVSIAIGLWLVGIGLAYFAFWGYSIGLPLPMWILMMSAIIFVVWAAMSDAAGKVNWILAILVSLSCFTAYPCDTAIKTIAYEASDQSLKCQIGVASVIKTRSIKRRMPPEAVCWQKGQFSSWRDKKPTQRRILTQKELTTAKLAWEQAKVWEYDHFDQIDNAPWWAKYEVKSVVIGGHKFYKLSR